MVRIVNWNIEWMNDWFVGGSGAAWRPSNPGRGIDDTQALAARVASCIGALGADLLCIQEGPSDRREMELFVGDHLAAGGAPQYEAIGGLDGGSQKIYALRRIGGAVQSMRLADDDRTRALFQGWEADVNGDALVETYEFTREPLVFDAELLGWQRPVRMVVLHTKSKYVHGGEARWANPATRQGFIVDALINRRRISAEGFRLRLYLDELLQDDPDLPVIVLGDFNDGPGRDFFETRYLTHNVTDILLGSTFYPTLIFHHPAIARLSAPELFTARFDDYVDNVPDRPLLLDHIIVSPNLAARVAGADIAHAVFEAHLAGDGSRRQDRPSDHRPVVLDLA